MPNVKLDTELYVTTPNEPGILGRVLGTLANAGVNLRAIRAYAERTNGVFMLLTSDNEKAGKALAALGYKIETEEVLTVQIDDRIGAGAEIGALLGTAVVDVEYCYGSSAGTGKALLVIKTNNNQKALDTLR
ncbi:MAG: ACT domain-containing protein [Candidatus Aminicenantes bacterium]|nr:ACT domain-containing protein [Candidatus Aminicenantes bacterium]